MQKRDLREILDILAEILQVQQELLAVSKEKQKVLVENKADKLGEYGDREMKYLSQINNLEKKRMAALKEPAIILGKTPRRVTIADLMRCAKDQDQREELERLKSEIVAAVEAQNAVNQLNKTLVETHIEYTEIILEAFMGPDQDITNYYDQSGNADVGGNTKATALFDTQA